MTKLNWEKANQRERRRQGGKKRKSREENRQLKMALFAWNNKIACFKCGDKEPVRWAKTGFSKRGPWAICRSCVNKR